MTAEIRAIIETASAMFAVDRALILLDATARLDAAIAALHPPVNQMNNSVYANAALGMYYANQQAAAPSYAGHGSGLLGGALGWWP